MRRLLMPLAAMLVTTSVLAAPAEGQDEIMRPRAVSEGITEIVATGEARVTRKPDAVRVTIVAEIGPKGAAEIEQQARALRETIAANLKAHKLPDASAELTSLQLSHVQQARGARVGELNPAANGGAPGSREPAMFNGGARFAVSSTDVQAGPRIIEACMAAGECRLMGVSFECRDAAGAKEVAIREATADALKKARLVAEASGRTLAWMVDAKPSVQGYMTTDVDTYRGINPGMPVAFEAFGSVTPGLFAADARVAVRFAAYEPMPGNPAAANASNAPSAASVPKPASTPSAPNTPNAPKQP